MNDPAEYSPTVWLDLDPRCVCSIEFSSKESDVSLCLGSWLVYGGAKCSFCSSNVSRGTLGLFPCRRCDPTDPYDFLFGFVFLEVDFLDLDFLSFRFSFFLDFVFLEESLGFFDFDLSSCLAASPSFSCFSSFDPRSLLAGDSTLTFSGLAESLASSFSPCSSLSPVCFSGSSFVGDSDGDGDGDCDSAPFCTLLSAEDDWSGAGSTCVCVCACASSVSSFPTVASVVSVCCTGCASEGFLVSSCSECVSSSSAVSATDGSVGLSVSALPVALDMSLESDFSESSPVVAEETSIFSFWPSPSLPASLPSRSRSSSSSSPSNRSDFECRFFKLNKSMLRKRLVEGSLDADADALFRICCLSFNFWLRSCCVASFASSKGPDDNSSSDSDVSPSDPLDDSSCACCPLESSLLVPFFMDSSLESEGAVFGS
mmetsp:Transcript_4996/g.11881  ORF Transcript_4996/g.11881 Transcript_4996/m.11881 type:complete len:428 (+) Transcript_4996:3005-4288(+)